MQEPFLNARPSRACVSNNTVRLNAACRGGHCWELTMDRLFAGSEGTAAAAAAAGGGGGGQGGAAKVLSFRGWTLDMLQVTYSAECWATTVGRLLSFPFSRLAML